MPFRSNTPALQSKAGFPVWRGLARLLAWMVLGVGLGATPAPAADREVIITGPAVAKAGTALTVSVTANTWARGEKIGFLHAEYSTDGGATWTGFCFEDNLGVSVTRSVAITAGAVGTKVMVRSRIAFRGGAAGDVDFKGQPIDWAGTWEKWRGPPTKYLVIPVAGP